MSTLIQSWFIKNEEPYLYRNLLNDDSERSFLVTIVRKYSDIIENNVMA